MIGNVTPSWAEWNFLAGELGIVERLKAATQTGPDAWARIVGTRDDLDAITEDQQVNPGVYVIYSGFSVLASNDKSAEIENRWRVVVAVSAGANTREAAYRNQVAGRFLPSILQALHGFIPPGETTCLKPVTPPPIHPSGKFCYYPLAFTSTCLYTTRKGPANGPMHR